MAERYTAVEIERMAEATYAAARSGIDCEPYDALPNWRRHRWRQAARAAVREATDIDQERRDRWKAARRQTLKLRQVS